MAIQPDLVGTITLTSGSTAFTWTGTSLVSAAIRPGDEIRLPGKAMVLTIATIASATTGTLTDNCPTAAAGSGQVARVRYQSDLSRVAAQTRQLIELLSGNGFFKYDAAGSLAERDDYDDRPQGFAYLDIDSDPMELYVKASDDSGDWAGPVSYATGPAGPTGATGPTGPTGPTGEQGPVGFTFVDGGWATSTAYERNEALTHNDVVYRCTTNHTSAAATEPGVGANWQTVWEVVVSIDGEIVNSIPGHSIRKLRLALDDPLTQMIGIVFMGDSITWGATLTGNAVSTPRDGTLSDPRDYATTPSYVNNLKAYIGSVYFPGATPVHTNWVDAPSGEAVTTWKKTALLYPGQPPFAVYTSGSSVSSASIQTHGTTKLGYRFNLSDGNGAGTSVVGVRFRFTGEKFKLWYASQASNSTDYTLLINDVSQGDFSSNSGSTQTGLSREHTFDYVRDAIIEIRLKRTAGGGIKNLFLEAIEIEKTCVITNQGIIGSDTRRQRVFILSGTYDTLPFTDVDKFIFYQIGTNNRGWQQESTQQPTGVLTLKNGLNLMINRTYELVPDAEIVMMAANMTTDYDGENFAFDMDQVRSTIRQVADERQLDFIDNYSIFRGVDLGDELADGLHPNAAGHLRMSNNIIARIEAS